jgi:GNAT superfamily N-acetyltransferase
VSGDVAVVRVEGWLAARRFVDVPYRLLAGDPCWVAPLRFMERRRWSPRHNPALAARSAVRFIALRDGRPVGRIAAVVDPSFHRWVPASGFFGFFESVRDDAVAGALLHAAESELAGRGVRHVLGPVNLSTHDEVGFLVDGFDRPPALLDPYNPPWYPALVERHGYLPIREYHAYLWRPDVAPAPAVARLLDRLASQGAARGIRIRRFRADRWDDELAIFHELYNGCFGDLWGFVPISPGELAARAAEFRHFYRPELILVAEAGDRPVGFVLTLPDANLALARARGRLLPFGWLRVARALRTVTATRLLLLGVVPEFRGRGVAALLAGAVHEAGRRVGVTTGELSLVQGGNEPMRHVIEAFSAPRIKTFRLYGRPLAAG